MLINRESRQILALGEALTRVYAILDDFRLLGRLKLVEFS